MKDTFLNSVRNKSTQTDTKHLWNNLRSSNEEAFTQLYNHYFHNLCRYGARITDNKELIEDSIQDLFVEIWKTRTCLPPVESVKYYLFVWLKRKIVKKIMDARKVPMVNSLPEGYDFEIVFSHESVLIDSQFSEEQQRNLLKALNKLTRRQKEAVTLRFYDGFTHQQIADLLSVDSKSVRNIIYRAMLVLRKDMVKLTLLLSALHLF